MEARKLYVKIKTTKHKLRQATFRK